MKNHLLSRYLSLIIFQISYSTIEKVLFSSPNKHLLGTFPRKWIKISCKFLIFAQNMIWPESWLLDIQYKAKYWIPSQMWSDELLHQIVSFKWKNKQMFQLGICIRLYVLQQIDWTFYTYLPFSAEAKQLAFFSKRCTFEAVCFFTVVETLLGRIFFLCEEGTIGLVELLARKFTCYFLN